MRLDYNVLHKQLRTLLILVLVLIIFNVAPSVVTTDSSFNIDSYALESELILVGGLDNFAVNFLRLFVTPVFAGSCGPVDGGDCASYISQSVPTTAYTGEPFSVSVEMRNYGPNTWTAAGSYRLGSQNWPDNTTWGLN